MKKYARYAAGSGLILVVGILSMPGIATAQATAPAPVPAAAPNAATPSLQDATDEGLKDIVVTAEKRSTSIQRTPIAIQAVDGESLKTAGPADIASIAKTLPSVLFGNANAQAQVTIRGIGTDLVLPGFEGRTAVHIDGIYLPSLNGVLGSFYDLERVEILEGPQGDLFGRNATAGAVDIVTRKPRVADGTNGYFQLTAGNYDLVEAQGAIGAALTPDLAFRIGGDVISRGGYGRNIYTNKDINDQKSQALRGALSWSPGTNFRALLSADYFHEDDANYTATFGGNYNSDLTTAQQQALVSPAFVVINGVRTPVYGTRSTGTLIGFAASPQNNDVSDDRDPYYRNTAYGVRLGLEYDLSPSLTLRSITGYRYNKHSQEVPTDFTAAPIITNLIFEKLKSFSQELQLVGTVGIQRFVVGAYYFHSDGMPLTQIVNAYPLASGGINLPQGNYYETLIAGANLKTTSKAIYVHDEIAFTDHFSLTLGGRYTRDDIDENDIIAAPVSQLGLIKFTSFPYPIPAIAYLDRRSVDYDNFSPRITASYKPDAVTLIYATYSRGFKSGGFNPGLDRPPGAAAVLPPFKPEKITDYEAGIKRDWFDRRLRTNIAAFYYDYTNLQVQQKDANALSLINNAATSEIYGVEANVEGRIGSRLTINAAGSLLHARYKDFCNTDNLRPFTPTSPKCAAQGFTAGTQDLAGNRLNRAPGHVFTIGGDYSLPTAGGVLDAHVDATFTSKEYFTAFNVETLTAPSHELVNASLRYDHHAGIWGSLWIKNITDRQVATQSSPSGLNTGANVATRLSPPRTAGATIGYNF